MKKILPNITIIMFLLMMVSAYLDKRAPILNWALTPVHLVQDYFSIHQRWSMFSPNPGKRIVRVEALIEYTDQTQKRFKFPSPTDLADKLMYGERFRKYQTQALAQKKNSHLWPDAARWVLRKAGEKSYSKIPARVILTKSVRVIPSPKAKFFIHLDRSDVIERTHSFYTLELR